MDFFIQNTEKNDIGFSVYSMVNRIKNGMMIVLDVRNFAKRAGAEFPLMVQTCRMLVDTGDFTCVGEDCTVAVEKSMPYAGILHLKNFYIRKRNRLPDIGGLLRS